MFALRAARSVGALDKYLIYRSSLLNAHPILELILIQLFLDVSLHVKGKLLTMKY